MNDDKNSDKGVLQSVTISNIRDELWHSLLARTDVTKSETGRNAWAATSENI